MNGLLPPPIAYVADISEEPPESVSAKFLTPQQLQFSATLSDHEKRRFLWSRLILSSVIKQFCPPIDRTLEVNENFSNSLTLSGGFHKYCSVDSRGDLLGIALSVLPINISVSSLADSRLQPELGEIRFPPLFMNWIERQPNPNLAFHQLWTAQICLYKRNDPTIRLTINGDDALTVIGSCASLHETLTFWSTEEWLVAIQGPALNSLLTEIRTPEKTIGLLEGTYAEPITD